jgi:hypothetical protein
MLLEVALDCFVATRLADGFLSIFYIIIIKIIHFPDHAGALIFWMLVTNGI